MEVNGKLQASATLTPEKEPPVPIGYAANPETFETEHY
jgi:hypothetical protein